jgi:hypothetical protein
VTAPEEIHVAAAGESGRRFVELLEPPLRGSGAAASSSGARLDARRPDLPALGARGGSS